MTSIRVMLNCETSIQKWVSEIDGPFVCRDNFRGHESEARLRRTIDEMFEHSSEPFSNQ